MSLLAEFDRGYLGSGGIIGVDEAGRGALAGPVSAACVWVSPAFYDSGEDFSQINDSKQLKAGDRELMYVSIKKWEDAGLLRSAASMGSVEEIEELNIVGSTKRAMSRALDELMGLIPEESRVGRDTGMPLWEQGERMRAALLVDGPELKGLDYPHEGIVKGDSKSLAIAMSSIIAKVNRDRLMVELAKAHPEYGFEQHKGYGTKLHREQIVAHGPLVIHRKGFIRNL